MKHLTVFCLLGIVYISSATATMQRTLESMKQHRNDQRSHPLAQFLLQIHYLNLSQERNLNSSNFCAKVKHVYPERKQENKKKKNLTCNKSKSRKFSFQRPHR